MPLIPSAKIREDQGASREAFIIEVHEEDGTCTEHKVVRYEVFQRWKQRASIGYVLLMIAATVAGYLGWNATDNLREETRRGEYRSCADRAELRIAVAVGFDELRRTAVAGPPDRRDTRTPEEREQAIAGFYTRTQQPIDRLLSDAAGATIKTKGELYQTVTEPVRQRSEERCALIADLLIPSPDGVKGTGTPGSDAGPGPKR